MNTQHNETWYSNNLWKIEVNIFRTDTGKLVYGIGDLVDNQEFLDLINDIIDEHYYMEK